jgi:hypothetical protein
MPSKCLSMRPGRNGLEHDLDPACTIRPPTAATTSRLRSLLPGLPSIRRVNRLAAPVIADTLLRGRNALLRS